MLDFKIVHNARGEKTLLTSISGKALLTIPQLNKGTAFTEEERLAFGLVGKLPPHIESLKEQVERAYWQYCSHETGMQKNVFLNCLFNVNQVLFYKLMSQYSAEMLPKIYTPEVSDAVEQFSQRFLQPRGLHISYEDQDNIKLILNNRSNPEVDLIVVSDGEGVLGIGDQGVGAMAIPVAKLIVYTMCGGIDPNKTLPIMLDVGTNNDALLNDPLYLGWRHPRISGKDYSIFIHKFVAAVKKLFPSVFLHWEDFGAYNAYNNLANYRHEICSFNDDIQGTGVVAIAAILRAVSENKSRLSDQRIVVFGAGSAGMGITDSIYKTMRQQGLSFEEAKNKFWLIDRAGLLTEYTQNPSPTQSVFLRSKKEIENWKNIKNLNAISLLDVIENVHPTILIGTSAVQGAFTQPIIEAMAKHVERPIILPLSNPTQKAEATPEDLIQWTQGKALIATGSPFPDVIWQGQLFPVGQCNNYFAFPGIGLGVIAVKAKEVSENMLASAVNALEQSAAEQDGRLLPTLDHLPATSRAIGIAVAKTAIEEGLAEKQSQGSIEDLIDQYRWEPHYLPYKVDL